METYLDLSGGLHTDFEPISQPQKTYRYLKDAIRELSGEIENESGTVEVFTYSAIDTEVIGSYVLDDDVVLFSYTPSLNQSEIGILSSNGIYTSITKDASLNFSLDKIIRAEGKKNFKGERIIYFTSKGLPMRVLNLDNVPTVDFNDNTKLVVTADMPQIRLNSVIDGGSLPTGVYQFGVRLLTKSTNSTSISLLTNPISVADEPETNRDSYDGALPQSESNKAISLAITNLDTDYEFYEIIAITFIGSANITKASVVSRGLIQGRSSIDFTYSNESQIREELDINGLVVDPINYDSAEFISQKDGILVLAGLTSAVSDYNFQSAANSITIKYTIKEEVWPENISINNGVDTGTVYAVGNDYKNSQVSVEFKSYQRDEVYSFAVVPIFKNWGMGNAYHIPAAYTQGSIVNANTTTKTLGTYLSSEQYPIGRGYPTDGGSISNPVRHHRMPTLIQEPHVQTRNGTTYIRMLGIKVDLSAFIAAIPAAVKKDIIGYVVVKQKRDETNKTILAQGIATGHYDYASTKLPSTTKINANSFAAMPFAQWPAFTGVFGSNNATDYSMIAFYSPETTITQSNMKSGSVIKPVIELEGVSYRVRDKRADDNKFAYVLLNYNGTSTNTQLLNSPRTLDTTYTQYIAAGTEKTLTETLNDSTPKSPLTGTVKSLITWRNPGYLYMQTSVGQLPTIDTLYGDGKGEVFYKFEGGTDGFYLNNSLTNNAGTTKRHLYNITRPLTNQYGAVFDAKYHYVKHVMVSTMPANSVIECFNGDTFITKYSVISSTNPGTGTEYAVDLKSLSYLWLESSINCGLRHFKAAVGKEGDDNYVQGTLPYYPKVKSLSSNNVESPGIFEYSSSLGHPTGYNKQYSFENTIRSYFPIAIELQQVSDFPNRAVYSEQSVEGEQLDAFRLFLANNFHDIPKEKGKITNLVKVANKLFVHTERSLWRTYFNEQVTQASSAGEVYLGNGGVFNRPSTEIITVKGGYGGTTSSSGTVTPFGYFYPDTIQKKVFMFDGEQLKEISDQGMFKYFKANISNIADTPGLGIGYSSAYDYENKRWLLTKIGEWTLSYATQMNSWSSFHSYTPKHYFSVGDRLYSTDKNTINEMNVGIHGVYYGELPTDMKLDIVVNDLVKETKTLDNLVLFTTSQNNQDLEQHYDTFSTLQVYNNTKNTGKCRLTVPKSFNDEFIPLGLFECFAKLKSNEFRIAVPNDLVIDVEQSIFDENNLDTSRAYRPRMSGKYFIVSLSYNNLRDNKFILHNIGRLFRQRIR